MLRFTYIVISILILTVNAFNQVAMAHTPGNDTNMDQNHEPQIVYYERLRNLFNEAMMENIVLSAEQRSKLRDFMTSKRYKMEAFNEDQIRDVYQIITGDNFDPQKAEAEITQLQAINKVRMMYYIEVQNQVYNILTPEQKKLFRTNFEQYIIKCRVVEGDSPDGH